MDRIISPTQTAFVPGRWIGENTILVNEIVHSMRQKKGDNGLVGIKIDMSRAYDLVEWSVLNVLLANYGFSSRAFSLISDCYMVDSSALLLNGSVFGRIKVERGLRQRDPVSPYLFILLSELLSRMLLKLESEGKIQGVRFGRTEPALSHLFFADDIMVFCRANAENVEEISKCLDQYCKWTGQKINNEKSGVFFSKNTRGATKAMVKHVFNLKELPNDTKYLGNPLFLGGSKLNSFEDLRTRVESKIMGWKSKLLSRAGRAVLVKSVISSIPSYAMASCKLPLSWCKNVDKMARRFFWIGNDNARKFIMPIGWDRICATKACGGLGIRKL